MGLLTAREYEQQGGIPRIVTAITEEDPGNEAMRRFAVVLQSDQVTDIQVISWDRILVKIDGEYRELEYDGRGYSPFRNEGELIAVLNRFLEHSTHHWRRLPADLQEVENPRQAMIETRLLDGSRIHITTPPVTDKVSCTIAKFRETRMTMDDILASGSLSPKMAHFLNWATDGRVSMLITGETGAGKTTLLQALGHRFGFSRRNEVVLVIEDTPELLIESDNTSAIVYWRVVHNDDDTLRGEVTLADLVKASLRRRMDRLIISEVRGEEAFYMVDANNTGTTGTLCTLHGNSAKEALYRLQNLCLRSAVSGLTMDSVKRDISAAFQLVVHLNRDNSGHYIVKEISEIGVQEDQNSVSLTVTPLFQFGYGPDGQPFQRHLGAPSMHMKDLVMERSQIGCPREFDEYDPRGWIEGEQ